MRIEPPVVIRNDLLPGDIGAVIHLHGVLYAREYGFDRSFEAYVAVPLAEFAKERTDRERIWIVERDRTILGSIAIVGGNAAQAQLRWFILHPDLRGRGLGKRLVAEAARFAQEAGYASVFLWTLSILSAATSIYQAAGFRLTEEKAHTIWGQSLTEQRYELWF